MIGNWYDTVLEAPFSLAWSAARLRRAGRFSFNYTAVTFLCVCLSDFIAVFRSCCSSLSVPRSFVCKMMSANGEAVIRCELLYSLVMIFGLVKPRPTRRAGRAMRSLLLSEGGSRFVRDGVNCRWIVSSRGCKRGARPLIVRRCYTHLLLRPWVRASNVACSSSLVKEARRSSSKHILEHIIIFIL